MPAAPPLAQQPPGESDKSVSLSKVERKNKAPVSKDLIKVKLPRPVEAKLDNGLTVLILENHKLPFVSMELVIDGAGSHLRARRQTRISLRHSRAACTQGTTTSRSSLQIAEQTDRFGASRCTSPRASAATRR